MLKKIFSFTLILSFSLSFGQQKMLDSLSNALKNAKHDTTRVIIYVSLSENFYLLKPDTVIPLCKQVLALSDKNIKNASEKEKKIFLQAKADALNNIGFVYKNKGDISDALKYYFQSLKLKTEIGDKKGLAISLNNIGAIYDNQGDIPKALNYFHQSLKLQEEIDDKKGMAMSLNNIGYIYQHQGDIPKALDFLSRSLHIRESIGDKKGEAVSLTSIGSIYYNRGEIEKALSYHNKSIKIREEIGDRKGIAMSLNNMGNVLAAKGDFESALEYHKKSLSLRKEIGNKQGIAYSFNDIANLYMQIASSGSQILSKKKAYVSAYCFADSSLQLGKELGFPENIRNAELVLSKVDSANGNYSNALEHYKQYIVFRDSINNESTRKASVKNQLNYEFEKKEAVLTEQQEKERAVAKEKNRFQQIVIIAVLIGLILMIAFAGFVFRTLKTTRHQKILIEKKQEEILDSIQYARRIQRSLLPSEKYIDKSLKRLKNLNS